MSPLEILGCSAAFFAFLCAIAAGAYWTGGRVDVSEVGDDAWARHLFTSRLVARRARWGGAK